MKKNSQNLVETQASVHSPNQELIFWQQESKLTRKQKSKFSSLVQFCLIFLLFPIYLVTDYRSWYKRGHRSVHCCKPFCFEKIYDFHTIHTK